MADLFTFEVHTPYRLFYKNKVEAISVTLLDGEIGVYAHHDPITAPVKSCLLKIMEKGGKWKTSYTSEGILEVAGGKTVIMADSAEWPDEIDHDRALEAKHQAEETLKNSSFKFESETAKLKLERADMRLKAWELRTAKEPE
ncbi:ATP synthase F1, epsilon subunit [Treponema primitia ZAS-2]|uniref:ATP synthase epsilon chain n=1 Tax=Treponema primitia (strain ATCC BAA-887 / DSM 12427 / ZAS-2) TaxID=545694 RepID=F5YRJ1_TREPZ|nr:ATP synthase F1 subunit epsilon [Treponema primitia]AEF86088.1 ATP synthase F1, epsilon subunit [Treponema primitia ZAS-2]